MEKILSIETIIAILRKTKKTDPRFRLLKKLKQAVESIGVDAIASHPTPRIIAFHFGLGNQLDQELLNLTRPNGLVTQNAIIPGQSFCFLNFDRPEAAVEYLQNRRELEPNFAFYDELSFQHITRLVIFLFCRPDFHIIQPEYLGADCPKQFVPQTLPGLYVAKQFLTFEEQLQITTALSQNQWQKLNNRRVQHFGYEFKYGPNQIDKQQPYHRAMPEYLHIVIHRLANLPILNGVIFDQLTVNDYFPGDGIPPHFDTHSPFEEQFVSLSLLSGIVMDFRKYDGTEQSVYLPPRSLSIFSGQARYAWTHGISCRKTDKIDSSTIHRSRRISLTFRKIKTTPCVCPYYFYCDSQGYDQTTMRKINPLLTKFMSDAQSKCLQNLSAAQIESEFVERAYNGFGFDFHNKPIPQIQTYLQEVEAGDNILDIGNGNGEYQRLISKEAVYFGVEKCTIMIPASNQFHMDCLRLCFRSGTFDRVLFVAVLHHIASQSRRIQCLREIRRVLRVGGVLYLSVLSYTSKIHTYSSPETIMQYCLQTHKVKELNVPIQQPRIQSKGSIYKRYYHLFRAEQIHSLLSQTGFTIIEFQDTQDNIILKAH